jgi:pimeloyl-ACP methyl ester carboxylesterase
LFGRGFSDDPSDLPHDARLYTAQILLAIGSSPLSWTGTNGFDLIGYSLGGGISASFTSSFPSLVSSLILLAPSGLVRESHIAWQSKVLYSTEGILPESLIQTLVRSRLGTGASTAKSEDATGPEDAVSAETGNARPVDALQVSASGRLSLLTVASAVQWQIDNHNGFIPAFISSIRHAPITKQHASWVKIGKRLSAQKAENADQQAVGKGLWRSKVLMVLGRTDPVIVREEVEQDATDCLGRDNIEVVIIEGGHDFAITKAEEVADAVLKFWGVET